MLMVMLVFVIVLVVMMFVLLQVLQGQMGTGYREFLTHQGIDYLLDPGPLQAIQQDVDDDVHLLDTFLELAPGVRSSGRVHHADRKEALSFGLHDALYVADEASARVDAFQRDLGQ